MQSALIIFLPKHEFIIKGPVGCYTTQDITAGMDAEGKFIHYYWCNVCGTHLGHEKDTDNERIHIAAHSLRDHDTIFDNKPVSKSHRRELMTSQHTNYTLQRLLHSIELDHLVV
jgi:hypothetical protein